MNYRNYPFKMGRTAVGSMLDDPGRRTTRVVKHKKNLLVHCSSKVAIVGHAIRFFSNEYDLAETGYKFCALKKDQVNLLMGYDVNTGKHLFARMYRSSCNDKSTIDDLINILFIVNRVFYSEANLELFSMNGNRYIIPIPSHLNSFKETMTQVNYTGSF